MRIIHVAGSSGSGKTTFIAELIHGLAPFGKTAAVKHLGHHRYRLEEDKDTTRYHAEGAAFSVGVDADKAVLVAADGDLDAVLSMLSDAGVEYAILEGFKTRPYPKIAIGDLPMENIILRNPSVQDVLQSLPRFHNYITLQGLVADLKREFGTARGGIILTYNGLMQEWSGEERTAFLDMPADMDARLAEIRRELENIPGIIGVRLHHASGRYHAGGDRTYIAVLAEDRMEAFLAVSLALDKIKRLVHHTE